MIYEIVIIDLRLIKESCHKEPCRISLLFEVDCDKINVDNV